MRIDSQLNLYSNYNQAKANSQLAMVRIATAQRINSAADDAASLSISEGMKGQINGLNQGYNNIQDSISMLNTAEGGMNSSTDVLQRMRELDVYAANGTLTDSDRSAIQQEMNQLNNQLNSNANNTEFNTINTNDGSLNNMVTQIGANSGQYVTTSIGNVSSAALGVNADASTQTVAINGLDTIDAAINKISSYRSQIGATTNSLDSAGQGVSQAAVNIQSAESRYRDADIASQFSLFSQSNIQMYASIMAMKNHQNMQQSTISFLV